MQPPFLTTVLHVVLSLQAKKPLHSEARAGFQLSVSGVSCMLRTRVCKHLWLFRDYDKCTRPTSTRLESAEAGELGLSIVWDAFRRKPSRVGGRVAVLP